MNRKRWIGSSLLLLTVAAVAAGLGSWKRAELRAQEAAASAPFEPMEAVTASAAVERVHQDRSTSIGTVRALRSVTLRNEVAGTVSEIALEPGTIVEPGTVLVALDVAVEEAELAAQEAEAALAETLLGRVERALENHGTSEADVDRARAESDVALARVARTQAVIDKKTIRAPFRARVGLSDVHVGQYLEQGTELTTLQGVDEAVHVDFTVGQRVAAGLREGMEIQVSPSGTDEELAATIVALDALVDPVTRNATVRARIDDARSAPPPGASVRVRVPLGPSRSVVAVPVSALRKGPAGDHVFVIEPDGDGQRAHERAVTSGSLLGDEVVIESGLAAGELVAASGSFKLREGVLVSVAAPFGAAGAPR
jgi:membrane fusion protein (multidrug efflux system)